MRRGIFAAVAACCLLIAPLVGVPAAHAVEWTGPAAAYIRAIRVHVPGPAGAPITTDFGSCGIAETITGCVTATGPDTYTLRLKLPTKRRIAMHEVGHVFDGRNLDGAERAALTRLLGPGRHHGQLMPITSWSACGDPSTPSYGFSCGAERFADAYAACALDWDPELNWTTCYGWTPTRYEHRRVCGAIRRFA